MALLLVAGSAAQADAQGLGANIDPARLVLSRVQVIRLREPGSTYEAIAEQMGLSRTGVFDICKRYERAEAQALHDAPSGRRLGQGRALQAWQERFMRVLIEDKTPDQLDLPHALWSRAAVGELIERELDDAQAFWRVVPGALQPPAHSAMEGRYPDSRRRECSLLRC